jgi:hypothetical protein
MVNHCYVPNTFGCVVVIPIVKDKRDDFTSLDNYRPITLSPVISNIFEAVLIEKFASYFGADDLQFGF